MIVVSFPDFLTELPPKLQNLMGEYRCGYLDLKMKGCGEGLSCNSISVVHTQLLKNIWTTYHKLFCLYTLKHKATIATVCLMTQFVQWPFKYQRCWSPKTLNQCFKLIRGAYPVSGLLLALLILLFVTCAFWLSVQFFHFPPWLYLGIINLPVIVCIPLWVSF